jgi:hypothetical protein
LQPQSEKRVKILISVPKEVEPGGHYATLFFESLVPKSALSDNSLYLSTRVGAVYFFVVSGDLRPKGSVDRFEVPQLAWTGSPEFTIHFKNEGNVHLRPESTIAISGWRGAELTDTGQTVLPGKSRTWQVAWPQKWLLGKYVVRISTKVTPEAPPATLETSFWAVPWQLPLWLAALYLAYIISVKIGYQRFKRAYSALKGRG